MITVTKQDNGVLFTFENSDKYLYGSGTIEVPFNSLSIIQDESDMISLRKAASNDIFLAARYDTDFGYSSKEEAVEALKGMLFAETGGGSGSGVTPSEVQEMIDESVSGKADTAVVNQAISEATAAILSVSGDVQTNAENISGIWDTIDEKEEVIASALTEVRQDVADIDAKEEVIASALTEVRQNKQDKLQYYSEDTENKSANIHIENTENATYGSLGVDDQSVSMLVSGAEQNEGSTMVLNNGINVTPFEASINYDQSIDDEPTTNSYVSVGETVGLGVQSDVDPQPYSHLNVNKGDISLEVRSDEDHITTFAVSNSAVTINDENVATESYVDAALSGKADTSALTAHADDANVHFSGTQKSNYDILEGNYHVNDDWDIMPTSAFYNFTSEYSEAMGQFDQRISANANAIAGKQDVLSAGTGIEISGNVISATGGGGATYSAGTNISIDTANTINCTIPAYFHRDARKGDIAIGTNITNTNSDYYKLVIGRQIDTNGNANSQYSIGIGVGTNNSSQYSQLKGNNSVGIGKYFQITDNVTGSIAIGSEAKVSVSTGVSIGYKTEATGTTKMNLNNQIKVDTNNQVYIKDKTNTTDVCIQDAIAALGGLKLVKLTQSEYDALSTKDANTLYIISNVVS